MKKFISLFLISIVMLSLVACNKECPVIGTWEEKYFAYDGGLVEDTLTIYENGYAEWHSWWTRANGEKQVNGSREYDWEYSNGRLRLEDKTSVWWLIYDANAGTLTGRIASVDDGVYKRVN